MCNTRSAYVTLAAFVLEKMIDKKRHQHTYWTSIVRRVRLCTPDDLRL